MHITQDSKVKIIILEVFMYDRKNFEH